QGTPGGPPGHRPPRQPEVPASLGARRARKRPQARDAILAGAVDHGPAALGKRARRGYWWPGYRRHPGALASHGAAVADGFRGWHRRAIRQSIWSRESDPRRARARGIWRRRPRGAGWWRKPDRP